MIQFADAVRAALPDDAAGAALAGRVWRPEAAGPSVVAVRGEDVVDITAAFPTMRDLCETPDPAAALRAADRGAARHARRPSWPTRRPNPATPANPGCWRPIDLQAIKAAGVTFAISMLERVIEERARGDLNAAAAHPRRGTRVWWATIWRA